MTPNYATRLTCTVLGLALLATAAELATSGALAQTPVPDWAIACAATTPNPWIKSGYCERHGAWDKYYCECGFVPNHPLPQFGGRRNHDLSTDLFLDEDAAQ